MSRCLVLATRNEHKLRELARGAARHRARAAARRRSSCRPRTGTPSPRTRWARREPPHAATGRPAIADDSGIEAAALGGEPGVRSARYAGEDATDEENLAKLLAEVGGAATTGGSPTSARSRSSTPTATSGSSRAAASGTLAEEPRGERRLRLRPRLRPRRHRPGDQRTMAELAADEKHAISHRGRAARRSPRSSGGGG